MRKEYLKLDKVEGPLIIVSNVDGVAYDEIVHIKMSGTLWYSEGNLSH